MNLRVKKHSVWFPGQSSVGCLKWVSLDVTVLTHTHHSTTLVINNGCYLVSFRHLIIITLWLRLFKRTFVFLFRFILSGMNSPLSLLAMAQAVKLTVAFLAVFVLSITALIAGHVSSFIGIVCRTVILLFLDLLRLGVWQSSLTICPHAHCRRLRCG